MVNRELLIEQAKREIPSIIVQWRENKFSEVMSLLTDEVYSGSTEQKTAVMNKIVDCIERNGCSVEKAIQTILHPEEFYLVKDEICLLYKNNYEK